MKPNSVTKASPMELLDAYSAGTSFFLASPRQTLLAQGTFAALRRQDEAGGSLSRQVAKLLEQAESAGHEHPMVVGAIPFDPARPTRLVVPTTVRRSDRLVFPPGQQASRPSNPGYTIREVPEPEAYKSGVAQGLAMLEAGRLSKIVLARTLELASSEKVKVEPLLRHLAGNNAEGYTFAVDLPQNEDRGRVILGASPELLVSRMGQRVTANPLAGSTPRSEDPEEDERRASALLASAKDRHEHAVVIEAVAAALQPFCRRLDVPAEPSLVRTKTMWHLSTVIQGTLVDPAISSIDLAAALHPTPAVCGSPTERAREAIAAIEPFERNFYAGMVGWCDSSGDGEWIVTIRCAEIEGNSLRLFAGAGVVAGSTPEAELAETSAKFRTMLHALGLKDIRLQSEGREE